MYIKYEGPAGPGQNRTGTERKGMGYVEDGKTARIVRCPWVVCGMPDRDGRRRDLELSLTRKRLVKLNKSACGGCTAYEARLGRYVYYRMKRG